MHLRIQLVSIVFSRVRLLLVSRARPPPPAAGALRPALAGSAFVLLGSRSGGAARARSRWVGIAYPSNALFLVAFGFVLLCCSLLARGVAALRPVQGPGPASGDPGGAALRSSRPAWRASPRRPIRAPACSARLDERGWTPERGVLLLSASAAGDAHAEPARRSATRSRSSCASRSPTRLTPLAADDDVSCVLLTGAGSAFCAGMDVTQFGGDRAHKEQLVESSARCFDAVARFPKPLVAFVNGPRSRAASRSRCSATCGSRRRGADRLPRDRPPHPAELRRRARRAARGAGGRAVPDRAAARRGARRERLGVVAPSGERTRRLAFAQGIAKAPASATREVKRRALLAGESSWLPLLATSSSNCVEHCSAEGCSPQFSIAWITQSIARASVSFWPPWNDQCGVYVWSTRSVTYLFPAVRR